MENKTNLSDLELAWLAGILEGEGSFLMPPPSDQNRPRISLEMTDEDVVKRVAKMLNVSYMCTKKYTNSKHRKAFRLLFRGQKAVVLMKHLYPLMGERRKARIHEIICSYTEKPAGIAKLSDEAVRNIRTKRISMRQYSCLYGVAKGTIQRVQQGDYYKKLL